MIDAWYYCIKISSVNNLEVASKEFFSKIRNIGIKLKNNNTFNLEIVLHIHADMAQVYFDLPQSMIANLEKLEIPLGISILSWGMLENQ